MATVVCRTEHFTVKLPDVPHVPREDGGHIYIEANDPSREERTQLTPLESIECAWLTSLVGEAMWDALPKQGINLYRINYQDNGNWSFLRGERPLFHVHLYGRAQGEQHQKYGNALFLPYPTSGFYDGFAPLSRDDIIELIGAIRRLESSPKYREWNALLTPHIVFDPQQPST